MNGINNAITSVAKNHIITLSESVELVPSALSGAPIDHRLHFNPIRRRFSTIRLYKCSTSNRLEVLNTRICEFLLKIETLKLSCFFNRVIWTKRHLIVISTTIKSSVSAAKICFNNVFYNFAAVWISSTKGHSYTLRVTTPSRPTASLFGRWSTINIRLFWIMSIYFPMLQKQTNHKHQILSVWNFRLASVLWKGFQKNLNHKLVDHLIPDI